MFNIPPTMFLFLYAIACHVINTNSGTTMVKINMEEGKLLDVTKLPSIVYSLEVDSSDDPTFSIVTPIEKYGRNWLRPGSEKSCNDCQNTSIINLSKRSNNDTYEYEDEILDCGDPVNFTLYDNLVGVANRLTHPNVPESQLSLIFKKKGSDYDVDAFERKLKKAKREKPKSLHLYNQIGNYWRVKGDSHKSIECFRRALALSPHNSEVLHNLARVLYNLQYLDDAIYLTRRSFEFQSPGGSIWQHYFTLGEIYKAYGHYKDGVAHMWEVLRLNPGFEPALIALRHMESLPDSAIHVYTLLIIICLVVGVVLVMVSSVEVGPGSGTEEWRSRKRQRRSRPPRHPSPAPTMHYFVLVPPPVSFSGDMAPFSDYTTRTALSVTLTSSIVALMYIVYLF